MRCNMARGWGGKEKLPGKGELRKLIQETDNLQHRKNKLKSEISVAVNKAVEAKTKELDELFDKEITSLNSMHESKIKQLESERTDVNKQRDILRVKDKEISEREKSVSARESKAQILEDKNVRTSISLDNKEAQNQSYIEIENTKLSEREHDINIKKQENTTRTNQLVKQTIHLEDQDTSQKDTQTQLDADKIALNSQATRNSNDMAEIEELQIELKKNQADTKLVIADAKEKFQQANELLATADALQKKLDIEKEAVKKMTKDIPETKKILKEREISVGEKERLVILKERRIDAKIKVLKQLRAG